ncbi:glutathione peroxidase [Lentzea sp. NBRC 105346]|uniref:glutathione peroxidase n=1 Tax=Lentzea sp. NBRC 105346 TaxID=3032205 RepID=UPI0025552AA5|nr:glutathione peroxidase [Lentzea sp. NBRC 105346]
MEIFDIPVNTLAGEPGGLSALRGKVLLIVNVASRCGLTPQYAGLERLQEKYGAEGFSVVGFPCNQFAGQEPGTSEEIATFCSTTYGVSFPLLEKVEVNGSGRHPVFQELVQHADTEGVAGDVQWNFEKFLVSRDGKVLSRFRPNVEPEDAAITEAIEAALR